MDELVQDLARPFAAPAAPQLVRPVGEEAPGGLALGQTVSARPEVAQEPLDRLARIPWHGGLEIDGHRFTSID